ncbi:2-phospho-L-lactate guanylyltransferase [Haloplanus sp. C73]|uniref:2-phospho-L-lactate guanylyltransferase n=1 Tax=Haloplanus sp. C73 TaxID=3421641 RepID=UPI003EB7E136
MRFLVPFESTTPKTRLDGVLDAAERGAFSRAMLRDVCEAVADAGHTAEVLATAPVSVDTSVTVDERPLSAAINARLGDERVGIVVADLALVTSAAVDRLTDAAADADVAIAPGRGGGTNALVVDHPEFRVDFHGVSYRDHRALAREIGASIGVVDSMRLATDVDVPADLVEVLLHGDGEAASWLRAAGFELDASGGRVGVRRE